ncbi:MAG: RraA family protein [bacterium]
MREDLRERLRSFSACQVADAFDKLQMKGHMPDIILLSPDAQRRMVGPAHTVQMAPAGGGEISKLPGHHVDSAPPGSVMVISVHPGVTTANWGGMMSTRARVIGLEGVVLDGRARDIEEHREMGFFVFARGVSVHGSGGYTRVASVGAPVSCGGMTVCEGDIILGDLNGVVVIPQGRIEEVLAKTEEMAALDEKMTSALEGGASIADTFAKYRG